MNVTRWTHGHTLASGFAVGLVIDRHALLLFAAGLTLGAVIALAARRIRSAGRAGLEAARTTTELLRERQEAEIARKRAAAAKDEAHAAGHLRKVAEQKAAEDRAYWRGATDATV